MAGLELVLKGSSLGEPVAERWVDAAKPETSGSCRWRYELLREPFTSGIDGAAA